jgi:threonine dehydrogenase-like Zn-dependent dehydrogenase
MKAAIFGGPRNLVVTPFTFSDGTCVLCRAGWQSNCLHRGGYGKHGMDGGQGETVRVPFAHVSRIRLSVPGSEMERR